MIFRKLPLDEAGKFTYISPVIEIISGFKPDECIGRHFADFVCREDLPMLQESFEHVLVGDLQPSEYRVQTKSGESRWVRSSSRLISSSYSYALLFTTSSVLQ